MEDYTDNKITNGNTIDDLQNLLEDMATESLLVELFNAKKGILSLWSKIRIYT